jgi:hypothetical protein
MSTDEERFRYYEEILGGLDQASRQHAATRTETQDRQGDRAAAIVQVSRLGVPRGVVARLTGLTRGRVQQILEEADEAGVTGDDWDDPRLRRLVEAAIADRPLPSVGVGVRRESRSGPHIGPGVGNAIRLTGNLDEDRGEIVHTIETLLRQVKSGELDQLLSLSEEELDLVRGRLIDD